MAGTVEEIVNGAKEYPVKSKPLWMPDLEDILPFIKEELQNNFQHVQVEVQDCPDLRAFGCAAAGLGGNSKLIEGGGEPFNHDLWYNRKVHFKMDRMAKLAGHGDGSLVMGAGAAGLSQLNGHIGELVPSFVIGGDNHTKSCRVGMDREAIIEKDTTLKCGGISNLYVCEGKPDKVIYLEAAKRTGSQISLPQVIRAGLAKVPGLGGKNQLGMGGVFRLLEGGRAKAHVNPDFEVLPENYYDPQQMRCVKDFLQFYEFSGPLVCLTCLWTGDPSEDGETLNLRGSGEHTHFWRETVDGGFDRAAGGHYHGDTTPDEVRYKGYFSLAAEIVRVWDAIEQKNKDVEKNGTDD